MAFEKIRQFELITIRNVFVYFPIIALFLSYQACTYNYGSVKCSTCSSECEALTLQKLDDVIRRDYFNWYDSYKVIASGPCISYELTDKGILLIETDPGSGPSHFFMASKDQIHALAKLQPPMDSIRNYLAVAGTSRTGFAPITKPRYRLNTAED